MRSERAALMNLTKIPLLSNLTARLDFLAARSSTVAQNIANADTPGYVAKDVKKPDFNALTRRVGNAQGALKVSDPRHLTNAGGSAKVSYRVEAAPDGEASINGNQVSLETQAMKLSETRQDYALASSVYRKGLAMLRLAARGN